MMLYKQKNLKFSLKYLKIIFVLFFNIQNTLSQETLRFKLAGVVSVVGDYVILDSDIDKTFSEME